MTKISILLKNTVSRLFTVSGFIANMCFIGKRVTIVKTGNNLLQLKECNEQGIKFGIAKTWLIPGVFQCLVPRG